MNSISDPQAAAASEPQPLETVSEQSVGNTSDESSPKKSKSISRLWYGGSVLLLMFILSLPILRQYMVIRHFRATGSIYQTERLGPFKDSNNRLLESLGPFRHVQVSSATLPSIRANRSLFRKVNSVLLTKDALELDTMNELFGSEGVFHAVSTVSAPFCGFGDEHLALLVQNTSIANLFLREFTLTESGAKELAKLTNVRNLFLRDGDVDASVFDEVAKLSKLTDLRLNRVQIEGDMLTRITRSASINRLSLDETNVTDQGLEQLAPMKLSDLGLAQTPVTDAGMETLASMEILSDLDITGTAITDDGLAKLAGLRYLRTVQIGKTRITSAGEAQFHKARSDAGLKPCELRR